MLWTQDESAERFSLENKRYTQTLLDKITVQHLNLASSIGNYQHALHDIYRVTHGKRLHVYGGLSDVCVLDP